MTSGWSRHVLEVPCIGDLGELSSESFRTGQRTLGQANQGDAESPDQRRLIRRNAESPDQRSLIRRY